MPKIEYYNHVMFIGLSHHSSEHMKEVGRRQSHANLQLDKLISDHNCILASTGKLCESTLIRNSKVSDGIGIL
jgi:hypothetical protein